MIFGEKKPGVEYIPRRAAYAVITDGRGRIAVVRGRRKYFLPGGGSHSGEEPEVTVIREIREEMGHHGTVVRDIGVTEQYFTAGPSHYHMNAHFFEVRLDGPAGSRPQHDGYGQMLLQSGISCSTSAISGQSTRRQNWIGNRQLTQSWDPVVDTFRTFLTCGNSVRE